MVVGVSIKSVVGVEMEHTLKQVEELAHDAKMEIEGDYRLRAHAVLNRIIDLCSIKLKEAGCS